MRSRICRWTAPTLLLALAIAPAATLACVGDCDRDGRVTIDELTRAVGIGLGDQVVAVCEAVDNDRDGAVTVDELVRAVNRAQTSCRLAATDEVLISVVSGGVREHDLTSGASLAIGTEGRETETGQACRLRDGSGTMVLGDRAAEPRGWTLTAPDGTYLRSLPFAIAGHDDRNVVPIGCAVDAAGRLFGSMRIDGGGGRIVVFFPPDYATSCVVAASDDRWPGDLALDDGGALYFADVSATRGELPGLVGKLAPPFPADATQCGSVAPVRSTAVAYDDAVPSGGIARRADGHLFVALDRTGDLTPGIREHDAAGALVREVPTPGDGFPRALAVDALGGLYYQDVVETVPVPWTLRRIGFDEAGRPSTPELVDIGFGIPEGLAVLPSRADEWLMLGGSLRRAYFNPREHQLTAATAPRLINKWRYPTSGMISAQAVVTWVDLPGEGRTQIVIASSWDRYLYALRADNGSLVWRYLRKPQPGTFYPWAGTPTIAWIDGQQRVFAPGGETMYCLDATTGEELWQFDAGTGCTDCTTREERNQIESSPAVANGLVFFSMDVNDNDPGKGGVYAVDARDGRLVWFFDLFSGGVCRPHPTDDIRRYDGYHDAEALGLPADFFATRPGCDHPRLGYGCGNVWSSPALDLRRGLLFTASSNCDTDLDPDTPEVAPPMPPHDEALFALHLDGSPAWIWRPREEDNDDLAFGAVPNLFEAEIGGAIREVVGIGNKDGTYYVLDRDGVNQLTGRIEPYWSTNVVPGGPIGGIIGSASVGEGAVVFSTGFGFSISRPQKPSVHALNAGDGSIRWQDSAADTSYAPCMGVPGLALCGGTPRPNINIFDRVAGTPLKSVQSAPVPSGVAAGATVVGGQMFVGAGTGAFNEGSDAEREALRDTPLSAFCIEGTPGCVPNTCSDGDVCTYDYRDRTGACVSEAGAEGLDCRIGAVAGACRAGVCVVDE